MRTPKTSTAVVINGADIKAGSSPKLRNKKGRDDPATEASKAIASKLEPTTKDTAISPSNNQ